MHRSRRNPSSTSNLRQIQPACPIRRMTFTSERMYAGTNPTLNLQYVIKTIRDQVDTLIIDFHLSYLCIDYTIKREMED